MKSAFHIHLGGRTQGVGFRPFVYRLAKEMHIHGTVANGNDGVHIYFEAEAKIANTFYNHILDHAPAIAQITHHRMIEISPQIFNDFTIVESEQDAIPDLQITPDLAMCADCRDELANTQSRRYLYPFITCTNCGPRYSITQALPYDRERTSMNSFIMCATCDAEYHNAEDRRYYSQTNSCAHCGIELTMLVKDEIIQTETIKKTTQLIQEGKIIAVKGIGGFLLLCDANNAETIATLRKRKNRPSKPFALLYPDIKSVEINYRVSALERESLLSPASPIVLLTPIENKSLFIAKDSIAPGLRNVGVMLPYAPLLQLIAWEFGQPLIATSGNTSGAPIYYKNTEALNGLKHIADGFLLHNRDILIPQDDSVVQFSKNQRIILRRARGMAPSFFCKDLNGFKKNILSTGADLKSSFAIQHYGNTYVSQYLGNLEQAESYTSYCDTLHHLTHLIQSKPEIILHDAHPGYYSTAIANDIAAESGIHCKAIQHHEAHFAAVLADNALLHSQEKILGVIWDGNGWGDDNAIWGSEFFVLENNAIERVTHLPYFPWLSGNAMAKQPRISALAICTKVLSETEMIQRKFSDTEYRNYCQLLHNKTYTDTSSMGRLIDAVASILQLKDINTYEGEAAMALEAIAQQYADTYGNHHRDYFRFNKRMQTSIILNDIVNDMYQNLPVGFIALKFFNTLVQWIESIAVKLNIKNIAFSGGVFQNALLVRLCVENLNNYQFYFHKNLSPNDECISTGQLAHYYLQESVQTKNNSLNKLLCV